MRFILLCLSLSSILSAGGIDSYLIQVNPNGDHSFKNIDFVYMINLDHRPGKWDKSLAQLMPYGVNPCRLSAVYGKELTFEDLTSLGVKYKKRMHGGFIGNYFTYEDGLVPKQEIISKVGRTYYANETTPSAIAITLSHLSVLQDAYDKGYETIWVMEDDVEVLQDPKKLCDAVDKMDTLFGKNGWDVLFTDRDTRDRDGNYVPCCGSARKLNFTPKNERQYYVRYNVDEQIERIGARFGAYSMIIRRSGVKRILEFIKFHKIFLPYDLEFYLPEGIRLYCLKDEVIKHLNDAETDNR